MKLMIMEFKGLIHKAHIIFLSLLIVQIVFISNKIFKKFDLKR